MVGTVGIVILMILVALVLAAIVAKAIYPAAKIELQRIRAGGLAIQLLKHQEKAELIYDADARIAEQDKLIQQRKELLKGL